MRAQVKAADKLGQRRVVEMGKLLTLFCEQLQNCQLIKSLRMGLKPKYLRLVFSQLRLGINPVDA